MLGRNVLMGTMRTQRFWAYLHNVSLQGMSVGTGSHVAESGERFVLDDMRERALPGETLTVFDVGANRGDYAVAALDVLGDAASVHCFEPSATAFHELEERMGAQSGVVLVNKGMSDEPGVRPMFADTAGSPLGSLYERELVHLQIDVRQTEHVELTTVDDYASDFDVEQIDLLKLDAEGHELHVLRGAAHLLDTGRIGVVQFEFGGTNIDSRTFLRDFYDLLEPRYSLHRVVANGLQPLGAYRETYEVFTTTNFIAIRRHAES